MALPPGPRGPALLHPRFMRDPLAFLERCRRRYGDVFRIRFIGMGDLVYFVDPAHIKESSPATRPAARGEANIVLAPVLGPARCSCSTGRAHAPPAADAAAFQGDNVRRYGERCGDGRRAQGWPRGEPVAMRPHMQAITLEVILRAVFGIRDADRWRARTLLPRLLNMSNAGALAAVHRGGPPLSPVGAVRARAVARPTRSCTRRSRAGARADPGATRRRASRCCSRRATRTASR